MTSKWPQATSNPKICGSRDHKILVFLLMITAFSMAFNSGSVAAHFFPNKG